MSRRERDGRVSDSRRHRSGHDRDSSPKRSRRDGKPETERVLSSAILNVEDGNDKDQKHRRRLHDVLPLEADSKVESGVVSEDSEKKFDGQREGTKRVLGPTDVPRSQSYFQHDERGNAAQVGRSFGRRATTEHRWRDIKHEQNERAINKSFSRDLQQRDGRLQAKEDNNSVWRHDAYFKMEAEPTPVRKRPAFTEKKVSENADKAAIESVRPSHSNRPPAGSERRDERNRDTRYSDRLERPAFGDRREAQRGGLRERYNSIGGNYSERERFNGRQGYGIGGTRAEKWKHDMFDESNKSPTTKNEEDQIAKVEALLAS
ncbi:uncharacterized protein LOC126660341 [Mercurialis annua]|uniref:uncharacterized protein LOC126660341 n=1 Tax=Mercurialis annua TaxID=3986 RepID=UPI00215E18EC|nr:uncharacterized protein LOC126660341 [Mercurialis annua]